MKITSRYAILAGLCAAGFLAGFSARHLSGNSPFAGRDGETETTPGKIRTETAGDSYAKDLISAASGLRSADTLETLTTLDEATLYGRLALWLIDASELEIAAFWTSYGTRGKRDPEINHLVFIHWTRLNPQSAMAAAVGTDAESDLWRAWAGHDPQVALHAASGVSESALRSVAIGIGEFQPDWLRTHFDELPEAVREAYAWWCLAAERHELAAQGRAALAKKLSPEQIREGDKLAKELRAQLDARPPDKGILELKRRAEEGDATAQYLLGDCCRKGTGVPKDASEAVKWYRKAAEQNHSLAQSSLGLCYHLGEGLDKNYAEAVKWYRKSAEQGNPQAQYGLGVCYDQGQGVAKDGAEAVNWYRKAAGQNLSNAQFNLAVAYYLGQGVTKDVVEAYAWATLAANTDTRAVANRDDLEKRMSPPQLAAGKKRAEELQAEIQAKIGRSGK